MTSEAGVVEHEEVGGRRREEGQVVDGAGRDVEPFEDQQLTQEICLMAARFDEQDVRA
ncbi:MAG: hypothetical protein QM736_22910 [Vicinamibacterales bacterium]